MKIAMGIGTPVGLEAPMGAERAFSGLRKYLIRAGVEVQTIDLLEDPVCPSGVDAALWMNSGGPKAPLLVFARTATMRGIPLFGVPVYWPLDLATLRAGARELSWDMNQALEFWENRLDADRTLARACFHARLLFPNSHLEAEKVRALLSRFYLPCPKIIVLWNGVDLEELKEVQTIPWEDRPPLVVCAGRIEALKNQSMLARAFEFVVQVIPEARLMLIGGLYGYRNSVERLFFRPWITLAGELSPRETLELFGQARVHALVSLSETVGLASLEAAALGCNVVVSPRGGIRDYLGDRAFYAEPDSPQAIAGALLRALREPPPTTLAAFVRSQYNWERSAQDLLRAIQEVLDGCKRPKSQGAS